MQQHHLNLGNPTRPSRTERALDYITALAIGVGLACVLVAWWSS